MHGVKSQNQTNKKTGFRCLPQNDPQTSGGGGGVSESTDRRGCAILALEVVPKKLIFT